jgi:hypothetical protein
MVNKEARGHGSKKKAGRPNKPCLTSFGSFIVVCAEDHFKKKLAGEIRGLFPFASPLDFSVRLG